MKRTAFALALLAGAVFSGVASAQSIMDLAKQAESQSADGKSVEAYETMRKATLQVWDASPLVFRRALFVAGSPSGFGIYNPRPDNVFKPGEKLVIYAEPIGFKWENKDGLEHALLVEWLWMALQAATTSFDASSQPHRQPVMAYALDAEPVRMVRSRIRSTSTLGRLCGTGS